MLALDQQKDKLSSKALTLCHTIPHIEPCQRLAMHKAIPCVHHLNRLLSSQVIMLSSLHLTAIPVTVYRPSNPASICPPTAEPNLPLSGLPFKRSKLLVTSFASKTPLKSLSFFASKSTFVRSYTLNLFQSLTRLTSGTTNPKQLTHLAPTQH